MPNLRTHPHLAVYKHTYMLLTVCLKKISSSSLLILHNYMSSETTSWLSVCIFKALFLRSTAHFATSLHICEKCHALWCLWAFCQIISIFLFQVLMIPDTHYARGGNVCPASLPLKSSPWQVQKGVRAECGLLSWIATVPSWLRTHDAVLAIIASTSVCPPITCSLYFLLWNNLCSLYPICQCQASLGLLPMLLCSLCIWICGWEQWAGNRVHLFSLSPVDTTAGPLQSHAQPPLIRPLLGSRLPKCLSSKESACQCRRRRRWGYYP